MPNGKLGLVASILVEKYLDGLPLHRQRDRYRRLGLDIAGHEADSAATRPPRMAGALKRGRELPAMPRSEAHNSLK